MEMNYASKGVAGSGLGLGIAGTALGLLNNGAFGNLFGNGNARSGNCHDEPMISRYEAGLSARIADLETEVKLRDANIYTDSKILAAYTDLSGKISNLESQICAQSVYNATNTAAINCINSQIAQLMSLTKLVIPNASICPGWTTTTT